MKYPKIFRVCAATLAAAVLALAPAPAAAAESASPWTAGPLSKVRLIGGGLDKGVWQAGVEISLVGEAHTYWRNPGDGGVPPTFDFTGSKNLKSVTIAYPAPARSGEAGMQIFGYKGEVIFPLKVIPADPQQPVALALHINYAACEKICMPAEARLALELHPLIDGGALKARIADYQAQAPKPLEGPGGPALQVSATKAENKASENKTSENRTWRVTLTPAPGAGADLFAEGPDGWFFDTKRLPDGAFELVLAEKPADAGPKLPPVTLTLTTDKGAFETVKHLDGGATTP